MNCISDVGLTKVARSYLIGTFYGTTGDKRHIPAHAGDQKR